MTIFLKFLLDLTCLKNKLYKKESIYIDIQFIFFYKDNCFFAIGFIEINAKFLFCHCSISSSFFLFLKVTSQFLIYFKKQKFSITFERVKIIKDFCILLLHVNLEG